MQRCSGDGPRRFARCVFSFSCVFTSLNISQAAFIAEALVETTCILAASVPSDTSSRILSALTNSATTSLTTFSPSPIWALGTFIAIAGGLLRLRAYRELGRFFTFEISILKDHELVTSGPFSVVRHPSYTGLLALLWGSALAVAAPGSWVRGVLVDSAIRDGVISGPAWMSYARALGIAVALLQLIPTVGAFDRTHREDETLKREFGEKWDEWAQKTPYRLIPGMY
jgi:protein-S-isoprenylcysteine O-methyltransferase Ste14